MSNFLQIANDFVGYYYTTFDESREKLSGLYRDGSMLTWEGTAIQGANSIIEKLVSLPFKTVIHKVSTNDAQPSSENGSILIMVTGMLVIDGAVATPMQFTQTFNLVQEAPKSYYVQNDVFRMVLG